MAKIASYSLICLIGMAMFLSLPSESTGKKWSMKFQSDRFLGALNQKINAKCPNNNKCASKSGHNSRGGVTLLTIHARIKAADSDNHKLTSDIEGCVSALDVCYQSCSSTREKCNSDYKSCLTTAFGDNSFQVTNPINYLLNHILKVDYCRCVRCTNAGFDVGAVNQSNVDPDAEVDTPVDDQPAPDVAPVESQVAPDVQPAAPPAEAEPAPEEELWG